MENTLKNNKEVVKNAKAILKDLGHDISTGHVYELLSRLGGYNSHNVAKVKNVSFKEVLPVMVDNVNLVPKKWAKDSLQEFEVKVKMYIDEGELVKRYVVLAESEAESKDLVNEYIKRQHSGEWDDASESILEMRGLDLNRNGSDCDMKNWEIVSQFHELPKIESVSNISDFEADVLLEKILSSRASSHEQTVFTTMVDMIEQGLKEKVYGRAGHQLLRAARKYVERKKGTLGEKDNVKPCKANDKGQSVKSEDSEIFTVKYSDLQANFPLSVKAAGNRPIKVIAGLGDLMISARDFPIKRIEPRHLKGDLKGIQVSSFFEIVIGNKKKILKDRYTTPDANSIFESGLKINIYEVTQGDWIAATSIEEAVAFNEFMHGPVERVFSSEPLSEDKMERLKYFDDDAGSRPFRDELNLRISRGDSFPQHFANSDW